MKIKEIMKKEPLYRCNPTTKLSEAARLMKQANCGSLPVVDKQNKVTGMITDRDICLALAVNYDKPHAGLEVGQIMTSNVHTAHINDHIAEVLKKMRVKQIGRLPVVDDNKKLQGIISIHDILSGSFSGNTDLTDLLSSGESISKTIKALNQRYSGQGKFTKVA